MASKTENLLSKIRQSKFWGFFSLKGNNKDKRLKILILLVFLFTALFVVGFIIGQAIVNLNLIWFSCIVEYFAYVICGMVLMRMTINTRKKFYCLLSLLLVPIIFIEHYFLQPIIDQPFYYIFISIGVGLGCSFLGMFFEHLIHKGDKK